MSPRSPLSDGEVSSEDGEKVTRNASYRQPIDINSSARLKSSSSRPSRPYSGREALMNDRNAHFNGYGQDRDRDRSRSPFRRDRSGSRSPYRADRDMTREKRRRQDDHYGKSASDSRRHKAYEERPVRGHGAYRDLDRPSQSNGGLAYNDYRGRERADTRGSTGERDRSRSPYRAASAQARPTSKHGASVLSRTERGNTPSTQRESTPQARNDGNDAKPKSPISGRNATVKEDNTASGGDNAEPVQEPEQTLSEAELIEQRRKKREAIKKKYAATGNNDSLLRATLESNLPSTVDKPRRDSIDGSEPQSPVSPDSPSTPKDSSSAPGSPAEFLAMNEADLANPLQVNAHINDDQGQSAADYDPSQDMNEDRPDFKRQDLEDAVHPGQPNEEPASMQVNKKKSADDFDMFAEDDDDDDMFAAEDKPLKKTDQKQARTLDEGMLDNWDYPDGHYRIINGELLENRYAVEQQVGKGTFATVVRARDTMTGDKVAIKIACRNDTMLKAGQKEMQFLERLNEKDPDDKRYIIRLLGSFTHKGHLCLVFEGLHMDLREVLKKFGRDVGINLDAVKIYAYQMLQALLHMKNAEVLHADLKPDNILVNEKRTLIKICDFGTATLQQDAELTPYLVSRFYRAPEVILGMDFDYAIDMWAIGCTLFELYAGRILFNGSDNNGMLRVIQECRGKLPNRLIKRAKLADKYFDEQFTFYGLERDKMTGNVIQKPMHFAQGLAGRSLKERLSGNTGKMTPAMLKEHTAFVDLLDKCLQLDPEKRIRPRDALHHQFFARPQSAQQAKAKGTMSAAFRPVAVQHVG